MRYPPGHKGEVRSRIVEAASRALRARGFAGVSIPELMKEVGLTHGGFYSHFRSRDALVAEAVTAAGDETGQRVFQDAPGGLPGALRAYLSVEHAADPTGGCVVAALGTDAPHQRAPVRKAFARVARGLIQHVQRRLHPGDEAPSDEALRLAARMVGAVVLARLIQDEHLAKRLLWVNRTEVDR